VTKIFWDATPDDKKIFVADPALGSRHNRGCAVDLTLYDLKTGKAIPMTGVYDEMSERSYLVIREARLSSAGIVSCSVSTWKTRGCGSIP